MPTDPQIRLGDAVREHLASLLSHHLAMGRLTINEFEERIDAALNARTRADVSDLLSDLPSEPAPISTAAPRARTPWAPWALTGVICLLVWSATSLVQGHPLRFWPGWVIGPWGAVLLARRWRQRPQRHPHRHTDQRP